LPKRCLCGIYQGDHLGHPSLAHHESRKSCPQVAQADLGLGQGLKARMGGKGGGQIAGRDLG